MKEKVLLSTQALFKAECLRGKLVQMLGKSLEIQVLIPFSQQTAPCTNSRLCVCPM